MDIRGLVKEPLGQSICGDSTQGIEVLHETIMDDEHQTLLATTTKFEFVEVRVKSQSSSETLVAIIFSTGNESKAIFRVFEDAKQGSIRNVRFRLNTAIPERILNAWKLGAEQDLIAYAAVSDKGLCILDCALNILTIPFDAMSALNSLPWSERQNFELDADGSYLYWAFTDTHLDLDSFKISVDPDLKTKLNAENLLYDERFGKAIATVRKNLKLKQTDIEGVSARHIGRIEKGARPKLETLKLLAKGHGVEINDYIERVAQAMAKIYP
ncbi:MAG: helix-turn-helix domain-containing protein [Timaviella obliquedivisa GSE-PSE-MK23-08B]|jgi:hypothetical protein|nr:helix-turn-helix domain-containing protein [Timaviella obliquedivisa GSE-PSE-MK23-08B]